MKPDVWTGETLDDIIVALCMRVFALGSIVSAPAVANGTVFITSVDGRLYALGDQAGLPTTDAVPLGLADPQVMARGGSSRPSRAYSCYIAAVPSSPYIVV